MSALQNVKVAVLGLGYVGLPLALAFAKKFPGTVGFDRNAGKVADLCRGIDTTGEGLEEALRSTALKMSANPEDLRGQNFFIVGVPTPVDRDRRPDLEPLEKACEFLGSVISPGATIVFESTVYPGVTEDICGPLIARRSGLRQGSDFKLAYSPERINPGDKEHTLERIMKVTSGEDAATADLVAEVYGSIIHAGIFRATSIKVAEAAKVIENTQRDLNIALMNELAIIFDRMGIATRDVLAAAGTKWNFLKFSPGLVGGHCIGVDPYYLTTKAEQLGLHPEVILAGRKTNDSMGTYVAQRFIKLMVNAGLPTRGARVGILGLTFKENVNDIRNSRVPDIIGELKEFGVIPLVHDPMADPHHAHEEYHLSLVGLDQYTKLDGVVVAVAHQLFRDLGPKRIGQCVKAGGVIVDVKGVFSKQDFPEHTYWSL